MRLPTLGRGQGGRDILEYMPWRASYSQQDADMMPANVRGREVYKLDATGQSLVRSATQSEHLQLSARAFLRVLKIAQTIDPGSFRGC